MFSTKPFTKLASATALLLSLHASSAAAASCTTPGNLACGNQFGAPPPDGAIYVCNDAKVWEMSDQCNGGTACFQADTTRAHCSSY
ncbi:hypothetical protein QBC40DRAFT_183156 [Triangularia verruculosa]|uniref:Uncharacterized protein n=1 Tax=Triangularia verruculosa TaxID=2587418 RepID=A0AAN7AS72_9PEZI|nr:hypothetical protein QBC40DRAFT_183156 [Triangularia verruculosa]